MYKILILYPSEFKCATKFERKLSRILENINGYMIVYPGDPNNLISDFFSKNYNGIEQIKDEHWNVADITHAIIFDDGEVFDEEIISIKKMDIIYRLITVPITRVINIKNHPEYEGIKSTPAYEYIGRGSYWGNPYSIFEEDIEPKITKKIANGCGKQKDLSTDSANNPEITTGDNECEDEEAEAPDPRISVIRKFQYDFERDLFPKKKKEEVFKLMGKRLGCFCKPEACHGDILADFLNSWDDGM